MARTLDLFPETVPPRAKPRVLMHVVDAGPEAQKFECRSCGYDDWYHAVPVSEAKRGIACPNCNSSETCNGR